MSTILPTKRNCQHHACQNLLSPADRNTLSTNKIYRRFSLFTFIANDDRQSNLLVKVRPCSFFATYLLNFAVFSVGRLREIRKKRSWCIVIVLYLVVFTTTPSEVDATFLRHFIECRRQPSIVVTAFVVFGAFRITILKPFTHSVDFARCCAFVLHEERDWYSQQ